MTLRKFWLVPAAIAIALVAAGCGIRIAGQPLGGAPSPTATSTRIIRPTFTPLPTETFTPAATNTPLPTNTPPPTNTLPPTATRRPNTPVPTRPPTLPPVPTATPLPTKPPYQYGFYSVTCEHSGGTYIKVVVYSNHQDPSSTQPGVLVRGSLGGSPLSDQPIKTDDFGEATFVLSPDGAAPRIGTYLVWLVDSSNRQISEMSSPIVINGKPDSAPDSCWLAKAYFAGR